MIALRMTFGLGVDVAGTVAFSAVKKALYHEIVESWDWKAADIEFTALRAVFKDGYCDVQLDVELPPEAFLGLSTKNNLRDNLTLLLTRHFHENNTVQSCSVRITKILIP